jgi:DNA/RNA endonuclease YhcR with UshA esterase domain
MKKTLVLAMVMGLTLSCAACGKNVATSNETAAETEIAEADVPTAESPAETEAPAEAEAEATDVMSYADYVAAELDSEVTVETYVQAKQSWWDNKATFYTQNEDGAIFIYEMPCTEEEYNQLVPGTKIKVTGIKSEWSGEVEIVEARYEIEDGNFVAQAKDATDLLGKDELIDLQNQLVSFTDMTVEKVAYKNEQPGDDIYLTVSKDGNSYDFCLEYYLNGSDEEFYNLVGGLEAGQVVDIEGFLYWYEGANPHITKVTVK